MSTLTLIEIRVPQYSADGRSMPDATISAEWFKAMPGALQYRVVGSGSALYFAEPGKAVAAATARARRVFAKVQS